MKKFRYIYGPVPSRRLGISLGISPIPKKTCNYSCIYCQLGRTDKMTNTRESFFPPEYIMSEFEEYLFSGQHFDAVTIVGEGEPTLYLDLGILLTELKKKISVPLAVITNGALLYDSKLQEELYNADIVLPSFDAYDEVSFRKINRPHKALNFKKCYEGLVDFSNNYKGELWLETMLMRGVNDNESSLLKYRLLLDRIKYSKLYINTPIRPPAEKDVYSIENERIERAVEILHGISIDKLVSEGFKSEISDDYSAILSIIKRHPMNQFEIKAFLQSRQNKEPGKMVEMLNRDREVDNINYKGFITYRLK